MNLLAQRLPRFLITAALLYVGWYLFYTRLIHAGSVGFAYDVAFCRHITSVAAAVLRGIGHTAVAKDTLLYLNGWHVVTVGWQCDGLPMMALFAGFILAYPGPWRAKLWFIPAGVLVIHGINILRVVALALNQVYSRNTTDFNHHYTYTLVVYGCIFWFWTIWVRRFASTGPTPPTAARENEATATVASGNA